WDAARAAKDRSQRRYDAAMARYDMMMNGSRPEDVAEAAAEVARTKAKSDLLEHGTREEDIALAEATVAEVKGRLAEIEVNRREANREGLFKSGMAAEVTIPLAGAP